MAQRNYAAEGGMHGIETHGFVSQKAFWRTVSCPTCGARVGEDCKSLRPYRGEFQRFTEFTPVIHKQRKIGAENAWTGHGPLASLEDQLADMGVLPI